MDFMEMQGFAPIVTVSNKRPAERDLYRKLWTKPQYRAVAPGEYCAHEFLKQARPRLGASVIDLGCGTGRGGLVMAMFGGLNVTMVDFADNCLDDDIRAMLDTQGHVLHFVEADLTKELPVAAEYGFCTDVMEHIPPEQVDAVLNHILRACQHVFFQIATKDDVFGQLLGHALHLSVHDYAWWLQKFRERDCVIHWSHEMPTHCLFYVSAWMDGPAVVAAGDINVTEELVRTNVKHNIAQGWKQVSPHETNDLEVMILGGGPSLNQFEAEIRDASKQGVKIVTLNGTYNWCLERGIGPVTQVMVDARPFNARFTHPVDERCLYLIASQCDPSVFDGLPKERTLLWHTSTEMIEDILKEHYDVWWPVPGGSTVLTRAICLLRLLGYKNMHLYGCDSCLMPETTNGGSFTHVNADGVPVLIHHAYAQTENDSKFIINARANPSGRIFKCHPWMFAQAQEFMDLIKFLGHEINLAVYGGGLLAHILETGASLEEGT